MASLDLPEVPASFKSIQYYLKTASTHEQRDPVVSYWCRLYAFQTGMKLSSRSTEETNFLLKLMDWLEMTKKKSIDNDAITNDIAAQAHLENWALKLFLYADENDRAGNFGKNVIQSFYTAGLLYDVLTVFGELSEEASQNRKYAKWKAAYIHNCLKNGETPKPGPMEGDESFNLNHLADNDTSMNPSSPVDKNVTNFPNIPSHSNAFGGTDSGPKEDNTNNSSNISPPVVPTTGPSLEPINAGDGVSLSSEQMTKAQKYIKWAGSALNYDDVPTTVMNLRKAIHLLTTGQDPA